MQEKNKEKILYLFHLQHLTVSSMVHKQYDDDCNSALYINKTNLKINTNHTTQQFEHTNRIFSQLMLMNF